MALTALSLGLALLGAGAPAQAQIRLAGAATNLQYTVTDLDPNDGIAAAVEFQAPQAVQLFTEFHKFDGTWENWYNQPTVSVPTVNNHDWVSATHLGDAAHTTVAYDGKNAVAAVNITPLQTGFVDAQEWAHSAERPFTLAPHSSISFSMDLELDLSKDRVAGSSAWGWGEADLVVFRGISNTPDALPLVKDPIGWSIGDDIWHGGPDQSGLQSKTAVVEWSNDTDRWVQGAVQFDVKVGAHVEAVPVAPTAVAPVPEPGEWAMLTAGMGLLGWRARRRQRSSGTPAI